MAVREIAIYPEPVLSQRGAPINQISAEIRQLVADMGETMYAANGIGLAGPQVRELLRIFVVEPQVAGLSESDPPLVFINPEISQLSEETEIADEGCLSFPGIYVPVKRAVSCRARAQDLSGQTFEVTAEDLFARVIQHETDHLNGKLLTDYVGPLKRKSIKRQLARRE